MPWDCHVGLDRGNDKPLFWSSYSTSYLCQGLYFHLLWYPPGGWDRNNNFWDWTSKYSGHSRFSLWFERSRCPKNRKMQNACMSSTIKETNWNACTYMYSAIFLQTEFLGLHIDEELSWKYHINLVTIKMSKIARISAKAGHYLSNNLESFEKLK